MRGKVFVFIICLKHFFLGTEKFGELQKNLGGTFSELPRTTALYDNHSVVAWREHIPTLFQVLYSSAMKVNIS